MQLHDGLKPIVKKVTYNPKISREMQVCMHAILKMVIELQFPIDLNLNFLLKAFIGMN